MAGDGGRERSAKGGGASGGAQMGERVMDDAKAPARPQGSGRSVNEPTMSTGALRTLAGELAADLVARGLSLGDVERLAPLLVDRVRLSVPGAGRAKGKRERLNGAPSREEESVVRVRGSAEVGATTDGEGGGLRAELVMPGRTAAQRESDARWDAAMEEAFGPSPRQASR